MFMVVTYPWPVESSHVELTGPQSPEAARQLPEATKRRPPQAEELVRWAGAERLWIGWYRLRMAVRARTRGEQS
jgi:hypothetical protein